MCVERGASRTMVAAEAADTRGWFMTSTLVASVVGLVVGAVLTLGTQWVDFQRSDRQQAREMKRLLFADFLGALQELFEETRHVYSARFDGSASAQEVFASLLDISGRKCLHYLDQLRFVADKKLVTTADEVWRLVRDVAGPYKPLETSEECQAWADRYWELRHNFVDAARADVGIADGALFSA